MLEQLPNLDQVIAESLQAALIGMLHSLKSEEHHTQMEQLNRHGLAEAWAQLPAFSAPPSHHRPRVGGLEAEA